MMYLHGATHFNVFIRELLNYLLTVFTLVMNVLLLIAWENTDMKL